MASALDGTTIASVFWNQMSVAPSLFNNLGYDPVEDVAHIGIWMSGPQLLVTHPDSGIGSVGQLIEKARASQPPLQYASFGVSSPSHIFTELLLEKADFKMDHVPFSGPKVLQAIVNREVPLAMGGVTDMLPMVRAGKLVPLAVTGDRRLSALPEVPTMADAGVPGLDHKVWFGLIAPKGTPSAIIVRLHSALEVAAANPEFRAKMELTGRIVSVGTPAAMRETIRSEIPLWAGIVKRAGITAQ
jgi:tripartite-type tricarboxylate transporter receptor subunit TctC